MLSPRGARSLRHSTFLDSNKLVQVEDCHQSCFYARFYRLAVMKHGALTLQSIQIAFVTVEFFI